MTMIRRCTVLGLWMGIGVAVGRDAQAECMERWTRARLERQLGLAEAALAGTDRRAQRQLIAELDAGLPCTAEILAPALAARLHRVQGMAAARSRHDKEAARAALAGAAGIEPRPPADLLRGEELGWYLPPASDQPAVDLRPSAGTSWFIDGRQGSSRPAGVAVLAQGSAPNGAVCRTTYLWPQDPSALPCGAAEDSLAQAPKPRSRGAMAGRGAQLLAGMGAAAMVTGGAFYGGAWIRSSQYRGPDGAPTYDASYYEETLRPWAAGGGITALVGAAALGSGALWAATSGSQRPLLQISGKF